MLKEQMRKRREELEKFTDKSVLNRFIIDTSRTYDLVYTKAVGSNVKRQQKSVEWMELSFEDRYVLELLKRNKKLENESHKCFK